MDPPTELLTLGLAVTPAASDEICADTSGSSVAEGLVETLDSNEEIDDWSGADNCEIWALKEESA